MPLSRKYPSFFFLLLMCIIFLNFFFGGGEPLQFFKLKNVPFSMYCICNILFCIVCNMLVITFVVCCSSITSLEHDSETAECRTSVGELASPQDSKWNHNALHGVHDSAHSTCEQVTERNQNQFHYGV